MIHLKVTEHSDDFNGGTISGLKKTIMSKLALRIPNLIQILDNKCRSPTLAQKLIIKKKCTTKRYAYVPYRFLYNYLKYRSVPTVWVPSNWHKLLFFNLTTAKILREINILLGVLHSHS